MMDNVSLTLLGALHIARLAEEHGTDPTLVAQAMMTAATRHFVQLGGTAATSELLLGEIQRLNHPERML